LFGGGGGGKNSKGGGGVAGEVETTAPPSTLEGQLEVERPPSQDRVVWSCWDTLNRDNNKPLYVRITRSNSNQTDTPLFFIYRRVLILVYPEGGLQLWDCTDQKEFVELLNLEPSRELGEIVCARVLHTAREEHLDGVDEEEEEEGGGPLLGILCDLLPPYILTVLSDWLTLLCLLIKGRNVDPSRSRRASLLFIRSALTLSSEASSCAGLPSNSRPTSASLLS
jgi:hypothetical protein